MSYLSPIGSVATATSLGTKRFFFSLKTNLLRSTAMSLNNKMGDSGRLSELSGNVIRYLEDMGRTVAVTLLTLTPENAEHASEAAITPPAKKSQPIKFLNLVHQTGGKEFPIINGKSQPPNQTSKPPEGISYSRPPKVSAPGFFARHRRRAPRFRQKSFQTPHRQIPTPRGPRRGSASPDMLPAAAPQPRIRTGRGNIASPFSLSRRGSCRPTQMEGDDGPNEKPYSCVLSCQRRKWLRTAPRP